MLERLKAFEASQETEHADRRLLTVVCVRRRRSGAAIRRWIVRPSRSVEVDFHQTIDRLRKMLKSWHERNEAEKKSLITQARHLSTVEDTNAAIDGVKRLHALWKETGPVSQDQAQVLWNEFHDLCDAVYKRREQASKQYFAGLEAAKEQAIALCEQVEQAVSPSAAERMGANAKVREWHAAFDALEEMPRADARALRDRFERAISRYETSLADQDLRDAEAAESNLFEAARHIESYERAVMQGAPPAELRSSSDRCGRLSSPVFSAGRKAVCRRCSRHWRAPTQHPVRMTSRGRKLCGCCAFARKSSAQRPHQPTTRSCVGIIRCVY